MLILFNFSGVKEMISIVFADQLEETKFSAANGSDTSKDDNVLLTEIIMAYQNSFSLTYLCQCKGIVHKHSAFFEYDSAFYTLLFAPPDNLG